MNRLLVIVVLVALVIVGSLVVRPRAGATPISGPDARARVRAGAFLLDVRSREEFASGSLPGAHNVPVGEVGSRLSEIPRDRDVIVFCASGFRSARAARFLRAQGYSRVFDLGSIRSW